MALFDIIRSTRTPSTTQTISEQLRSAGLKAGDCILLHSSLAALGWVSGGAVAVVDAFLDVLGTQGTLMVPTHTPENTDPCRWENPKVPPSWWPIIKSSMPAFSPELTPARQMGAIAETFRTYPNVVRSTHPIGSFAASGPFAHELTQNHGLEHMFDEYSPLGRLSSLGGRIVLLGVGHLRNTSLHLAESKATWPGKRMMREGTRMTVGLTSKWVEFDMLCWNSDDFETIGQQYESHFQFDQGRVGAGQCRIFDAAHLVAFATEWMTDNRRA